MYAQSNVVAPKQLKGIYLPDAVTNRNTDAVLLEWQWEGDITRPGWFTVFRSIRDDMHFEPIAVSKDVRYLDDDLLYRNVVYYYYTTRVDENGEESEPSNIVKVEIPKKELVRIISNPGRRAFVGVEYRYQVQVVSSDPGIPLKYVLETVSGYSFPEGMKIDKRNGMLRWIPRVQGRFQAMVVVYADNSARDSQLLDICVTKIPGFGALTGTIQGEGGEALSDVAVTAFLVGYTSTTGIDCSGKMIREQNPVVRSDENGRFRFDQLEAGSYLLVAKPFIQPYPVTWWQNAATAREADIVHVSPGGIVEANFKLRKALAPEAVQIDGTVTDAKGTPVPKAQIRAVILASSIAPVCIKLAYTDEAGKYSLKVPAGVTFILAAWSEGYQLKFYPDANSLMDAVKLKFDKDARDLNFQLDELRKQGRPITGRIFNRFGVGVPSLIQVLRLNSGRISVEQSIPTNHDGTYSGMIESDQPISLLAIPIQLEKYAPAYYSGTPLTALKWSDSRLIPGQAEVLRADIVIPEIRHTGAGMITGKVTDSKGKPIFAASVLAQDDEGIIVGHAFSMDDGSYTLSGIPEGDIKILADYPAYSCRNAHTVRVAYSDRRVVDDMNLILSRQVATGITSGNFVPMTTELSRNYPNPFNPATQLRVLVSRTEKITLRVIDMYGRTVTTLIDDVLEAGTYTVTFRAEQLSRGVYTAVLSSPQGVFTQSMLLIK
ncbi:MAG: T9SS type A sorting domain-containing protein [Chlorobi bacterium]|nr:T9SS type A sorting domain-containing protein [Chlorobiota bacterium]